MSQITAGYSNESLAKIKKAMSHILIRYPQHIDILCGSIPRLSKIQFFEKKNKNDGYHEFPDGDVSKPCTPGEPQNSW